MSKGSNRFQRMKEPGWEKIGVTCSAGRRSLWMRLGSPGFTGGIGYFELCAGREGDDDYVKVDRSNPQYDELLNLFLSAKYAAET